MSAKEFAGRAVYYALSPIIHLFLRNSRRAYVVVQHEDKILVVKNVLGRGKWHLPGGGCHKNEGFDEAAIRELNEEVGIKALASELTRLSPQPFRSKRRFDYQLFHLPVVTQVDVKLDRREILESMWIAPSELNETNAGESTLQAIQSKS